MPDTYGTRPLSWYAEQTPPDDDDETAEDRESRDADRCDELLHERYEKEGGKHGSN